MAKNILVIDDEGLVTKSLQRLLKKEGFNVVIAAGGEEAIEQCKGVDFDLIVSDIRMPQLDGIATIRKIRALLKESGKQPIPEIFITGYADEDAYKNALELKVADYIYKPFYTKEFVDKIKKNLDVAKE
ncbi:MAG: response regulator [Candidatus Omnitrophica bacterium]|nr:response regulator [Candidatus Omnitrophota bacterium]